MSVGLGAGQAAQAGGLGEAARELPFWANGRNGPAQGAASEAGAWSLDRLVTAAVGANPRVQMRQEKTRGAEAGVAGARWQYFPTPSVQGERWHGIQVTTLQLKQPLWSFSRLDADLDAARSQAASAQAGVGETRLDVAMGVIEVFGRLALANENRRIYRADIERLELLEAMMRRRVGTGLSAEVEYSLVLSRLSQSRNGLTGVIPTQRSDADAMSQLTGETVRAEDIVLASGDAAGSGGITSEDEVVDRALASNLALKRAQADMVLAAAQVIQARKALLPTIYATAMRTCWHDERYYASPFPDSRITINVEYAFGAGLSNFSGIDAAVAADSAAKNAYEAARSELIASVSANLQNLQAARTLATELRQTQLTQKDILESYYRMFLAGKRNWLDVLNVMREQTEIDRTLANAEVQLEVAAYRLRLEMGDAFWIAKS
ncbi:MAG: TolC family protein [Candidatus Protistobacter heckmanni]|nr:TolC family protein [Candidatus Protistobacter heckmanni]